MKSYVYVSLYIYDTRVSNVIWFERKENMMITQRKNIMLVHSSTCSIILISEFIDLDVNCSCALVYVDYSVACM